IHIDRQLPFLCVYRRPTRHQDVGTEQLVMGQPAYLTALGQKSLAPGLSQLVESTVKMMSNSFGSFLIIEIWCGLEDSPQDMIDPVFQRPAFNIIIPKQYAITNTAEVLEKELAAIEIHQKRAKVSVVSTGKPTPPHLPALLSEAVANKLGCVTIGIVVRPIYRQLETGENLPFV